MKVRIFADADSVARAGAAVVAAEARAAIAARGGFVMAVSGGRTPWVMLRALAREDVPWRAVHVVQGDERGAPAGDPERKLAHFRENLLRQTPVPPERIHAMAVEAPHL